MIQRCELCPFSTAQAKQRSADLEAQLKDAQAAAAAERQAAADEAAAAAQQFQTQREEAETAASAAGRDAGAPLRQQLLQTTKTNDDRSRPSQKDTQLSTRTLGLPQLSVRQSRNVRVHMG